MMKTSHRRFPIRMLTLAAGLIVAAPLAAQLSGADREVLVDFFLATGGDDWIRNDGWLDPDVDPCDWFGVVCEFRSQADGDVIIKLELPNNNLTGELPGVGIFQAVFMRLDLSGNRLEGVLEKLPSSPAQVDLSDNLLSGALPAERAERVAGVGPPNSTWRLDLSGNRFDGEAPETWLEFGFLWLDLSDNRLEGMPDVLFDGPQPRLQGRFVNLADNRFSGNAPAGILDTPLLAHNNMGRWGGGVNLCWNEFEVADAELDERLRERHVGGENYTDCLGRERLPIDATVSGSWYDPARSGEGLSVHLLDRGDPLLYWFTFDDQGNQRWLIETGTAGERHFRWRELVQTRGRFSEGLLAADADPVEVRGSLRFDRTGADSAQVERVFIDKLANPCLAIFPPQLGCFGSSITDRLEHFQLTRLAGTACDNRHPNQWISGSWYDPERSGEGFVVEVIEVGRGVVYWFTHAPDDSGAQAWMTGIGNFDGNTLQIENLVQPTGARFGADFDPGDVERVPWGTLTMEFFDEDSGHVLWDSVVPEFGSGEHPLTRLARPMLAECLDK